MKKNTTYLKLFLFLILLYFIIFSNISSSKDNKTIQDSISSKIIRFHVIANSDSNLDQSLKLLVKKDVLDYLEPILSNISTIEDARVLLNNELNNITNISLNTLKKNNCTSSVKVQLCTDYFPVKMYGNLTLPAGWYEALQINIGDASGKNWWCVVYPSLCFVDCTYSVLPKESEKKMQTILTEEEYNSIIDSTTIHYDFKILEIIRDLKSFFYSFTYS